MIFTRKFASVCLILTCAASVTAKAQAQGADDALRIFEANAYSGQFETGVAELTALTRRTPRDGNAHFALGTMQAMRAVARYQSGIAKHLPPVEMARGGRGFGFGLLGPLVPMLGQIKFGALRPNQTAMTYERLAELSGQFIADLETAEASLARVGKRPAKLTIKPFQIAYDIDQNGRIDTNERLFNAILTMTSRRLRRGLRAAEDATVAFDTADASWLRGYLNLILAGAKFVHGLDSRKFYNATAHRAFGNKANRFGRRLAADAAFAPSDEDLDAKIDALAAQQAKTRSPADVRRELKDLRDQIAALPNTDAARAERRKLRARRVELMANRRELSRDYNAIGRKRRALERKRNGNEHQQIGSIMDLIAGVRLLTFDVTEPRLIDEARQHLIRVTELNRQTWALARAETDNDREWLPNAKQTAPFGSQPVSNDVVDAWIATLDTVRGILVGDKLVRHPRFHRGVNLARFLKETRRIDVFLIGTGHALSPYLETGKPVVDADTFQALTRPMGRDVFGYAVWFN
ncbi:MAG: hypothetical protein AAFR70_00200 [Pseudomonadota bacterium]